MVVNEDARIRKNVRSGPGEFRLSRGRARDSLAAMENVSPLAVLCLFLSASMLCAQEPAKVPAKLDAKAEITVLAAAYKADTDEVAAEYEKWFVTLQKWYLTGLDKLQGERTREDRRRLPLGPAIAAAEGSGQLCRRRIAPRSGCGQIPERQGTDCRL